MAKRYYLYTAPYKFEQGQRISLLDTETNNVILKTTTNSVDVFDGQIVKSAPLECELMTNVPTDVVDRLLKQMHMLSATLIPYFNEGKHVLFTPIFSNNHKPVYFLRKRDEGSGMVSIIKDDTMSFEEYCSIVKDTAKPYDEVLSDRITYVYKEYRKLLNELFNRYGNVYSNH